MFKTLLLIFIIYIGIQFIRAIFRTRVIIKNFNYQDHRTQEQKPEGKVTISKGPSKNGSGKSDDSGDYVDYEEVK